jgi:dinuclear metal center YbgI/SA1388 family protein
MMKIADVINVLEQVAPRSMQESYDNSGLLIGDKNNPVKGVLVALDCTQDIVQEAIDRKCNLILTHHPLIYKGVKKLTGSNLVEKTIVDCVKHDISLYAIHTNLDNYQKGVNFEIANRLGLQNVRVLRPKENVLTKLVVYVPVEHAKVLKNALFDAGAGKIGNYHNCSFSTEGTGTFMPVENADPFIGKMNELETTIEYKLEFLVSDHILPKVLKAMKNNHPYEEVAYDLIQLKNQNQFEGSGMIGELEQPMAELDFLKKVKKDFHCGCIRYTELRGKDVRKVAFCGGSGSFLLSDAKAAGADVFITGDFKYHEFFDAEGDIVIADIGHYESEQFTVNLLADILKKNFSTFAVHLTGINTNPINYF